MVRRSLQFLLFGAAACGLLGCGTPSAPNPSDPATGRDTLQKALEAWKAGDTIDAYKLKAPMVTVVEKSWKDGAKLLEFEIASDTAADGYDVQFKAKLVVKDAAGKQTTQKAVYNVSTTPALVIVRAAQ